MITRNLNKLDKLNLDNNASFLVVIGIVLKNFEFTTIKLLFRLDLIFDLTLLNFIMFEILSFNFLSVVNLICQNNFLPDLYIKK